MINTNIYQVDMPLRLINHFPDTIFIVMSICHLCAKVSPIIKIVKPEILFK